MARKKIEGFTQPMTSMDYFFSDNAESRTAIKAALRTATVETSLRQNDSTTLIFIKSGTGTITVNADEYELRRGTLMAISDYQTYKISPAPGEALEYVECQFEYMLFLYFMANPYFKFRSPGFGSHAVYALLDKTSTDTVERLMSYILISHAKGKYGEREILQTMEIFGFLIKYADTEALISFIPKCSPDCLDET